MKVMLPLFAGCFLLSGSILAQEQDPAFDGPSQALRRLYRKISHGPHKTGVDVTSHEACPECGQLHDPSDECIERVAVPDCVTGKKRLFRGSVRYEYVVVAEVRYRWKTKWITKEVPADCEEPVCRTDESNCPTVVDDWETCDTCEGKMYCKTTRSDIEGVETKRIECAPGQTTIKVRYKSCVKEPYTVFRQIKRPIGIKQPCYEKVDVPVTRYVGHRLKKECD